MLGFVKERKGAIVKVVGALYGVHALRGYMTDRLDELKEKLEEERFARNNLRNRFNRTQDDVSFLVLRMLPGLGAQIMEVMDIDALRAELQTKVKPKRQPLPATSLPNALPLSDVSDSESQLSASVASSSFSNIPSSTATDDAVSVSGLQGWIEESQLQQGQQPLHPSIISLGSETYTSSSEEPSLASSSVSIHPTPSPTRSKAELWNLIKLQTFTRTLTVLYTTTLLSLLLTVQLSILTRYKYVRSVEQQAHEAQKRAAFESQFSLSGLLWGAWKGLDSILAGDLSGILGAHEPPPSRFDVPEEAESKFLSMSWWILHVGWKDLAERVEREVNGVLEGVSVRENVSAMDIQRIVRDVRRRVEHEITFEGVERRVNFQSSLLPSTPETLKHLLFQNGFGPDDVFADGQDSTQSISSMTSASVSSGSSSQPHHNSHSHYPHLQDEDDPMFTALLDETRQALLSADFAHVLESALDKATDVLLSDVETELFAPAIGQTSGIQQVDEGKRVRLANMLPALGAWTHGMLEGYPSVLVDDMLSSREVTTLSVLLFAKFADETW